MKAVEPQGRAGLELLLVVITAALCVELILWLWSYRHQSFRSLRVQVEKQRRKSEGLKNSGSPLTKRNKKVDRLELQLREQVTRQLATMRLKQTCLMGASLFLLYRQLSSRYHGLTLARLPFQPPSLIRKLTQRGLPDPAVDDCGFVFLYAILNVGVRPNVAKFLDLGPTRKMLSMAGFAPPSS